MPAGAEFSQGIQHDIAVFSSSDEICICGTLKKEAHLSVAILDKVANEFTQPKEEFPQVPKKGVFASCGSAPPDGKYESGVYIGDVLVASLDFEVTE